MEGEGALFIYSLQNSSGSLAGMFHVSLNMGVLLDSNPH
jgi:hypothetical protein